MVATPGGLPQEVVVALQRTLAARAPQATGVDHLVGAIDAARRHAGIISNTYSARDGRGNALH